MALPSSIRRRWQRRLRRIEPDLRDLVQSRFIFREVATIVRSNPPIQKPGLVHSWIAQTYALAVVVAIRRLTDERNDSVSLLMLLREVAANASLIRPLGPAFIRVDGGRLPSHRYQHFKNVAGARAKYLPPSVALRDARSLKRARDRIRAFVNKRVAHLDVGNRRVRVPTFREVHEAIDTLVSVFVKYRGLLTPWVGGDLEPKFQFNWKAVFREPWIPPKPRAFAGPSKYLVQAATGSWARAQRA